MTGGDDEPVGGIYRHPFGHCIPAGTGAELLKDLDLLDTAVSSQYLRKGLHIDLGGVALTAGTKGDEDARARD